MYLIYISSTCMTAGSYALNALAQESKVFFLDLKENLRGKYVKISERSPNNERSTVVVPGPGIVWFEALLSYFNNFPGG